MVNGDSAVQQELKGRLARRRRKNPTDVNSCLSAFAGPPMSSAFAGPTDVKRFCKRQVRHVKSVHPLFLSFWRPRLPAPMSRLPPAPVSTCFSFRVLRPCLYDSLPTMAFSWSWVLICIALLDVHFSFVLHTPNATQHAPQTFSLKVSLPPARHQLSHLESSPTPTPLRPHTPT